MNVRDATIVYANEPVSLMFFHGRSGNVIIDRRKEEAASIFLCDRLLKNS
jgi:hypothetical protein